MESVGIQARARLTPAAAFKAAALNRTKPRYACCRAHLNITQQGGPGVSSIQELNGLASQRLEASGFWHVHAALVRATQDRVTMTDGRWNEWGHSSSLI